MIALAGAMRLQAKAPAGKNYRFAVYPRWDLAAGPASAEG
jgi:hypothetical protein